MKRFIYLPGVYILIIGSLLYYSKNFQLSVDILADKLFCNYLDSFCKLAGTFTNLFLSVLAFNAMLLIVVTANPIDSKLINTRLLLIHLVSERIATTWILFSLIIVPVQVISNFTVHIVSLVNHKLWLIHSYKLLNTVYLWLFIILILTTLLAIIINSFLWGNYLITALIIFTAIMFISIKLNLIQNLSNDFIVYILVVFTILTVVIIGITIILIFSQFVSFVQPALLVLVDGILIFTYGISLGVILYRNSCYPISVCGWIYIALITAIILIWLLYFFSSISSYHIFYMGGIIGIFILITSYIIVVQPSLIWSDYSYPKWNSSLGYILVDFSNINLLFTTWRFDPILGIIAIVLTLLYTYGFLSLRIRGDYWPISWYISWLVGCIFLVLSSNSGIKVYGSAMFNIHIIEHMMLNMFTPILLTIGGPVTLTLRVVSISACRNQLSSIREWILYLLHSSVTKSFLSPVFIFTAFTTSLYIVYFTPIFEILECCIWGQELMSIHFLTIGYLFYWTILGVDPSPSELPFLGKLGLLFSSMPFHAFFGIITMTMSANIGSEFYQLINLPYVNSIHHEQYIGGAIAWGASEMPVLFSVIILISQWVRQDLKSASYYDRSHSKTLILNPIKTNIY